MKIRYTWLFAIIYFNFYYKILFKIYIREQGRIDTE